jgi:hypothetical protein
MLKNDGHHSSQVTIRVTTIEKGRILDAARTEMRDQSGERDPSSGSV